MRSTSAGSGSDDHEPPGDSRPRSTRPAARRRAGQRDHRDVDRDVRRGAARGSAATRSTWSPTRSSPTTSASAIRTGSATRPGIAGDQRRRHEPDVGHRLAPADRPGQRAPDGVGRGGRREPSRPGAPGAQVVGGQHGAGAEVVGGDRSPRPSARLARPGRVHTRPGRRRRAHSAASGRRRASTVRRTARRSRRDGRRTEAVAGGRHGPTLGRARHRCRRASPQAPVRRSSPRRLVELPDDEELDEDECRRRGRRGGRRARVGRRPGAGRRPASRTSRTTMSTTSPVVLGRAGSRGVLGPAVVAVEAGALEHHADGVEHLAQPPAHSGQTVSASSVKLWTCSKAWPHSVQAYW